MSYTEEEKAFAAMLVKNGWAEDDALKEARRALAEAAEEDGYDGP